MNVIILSGVLKYLENLVIILYKKEYFGFLETSRSYVKELLVDIKTNLPAKLHKPAPKYFDKYGKGMKYAVFRKNKRTNWYAFFKTYRKDGETYYVVRYIANNHIIAQYL
jgi:hypothetical protein